MNKTCNKVYDVLIDNTRAVGNVAVIKLDERIKGIVSVALLEAEIPITFNVFSGASLTLTLRTSGIDQAFTVAIDDGTWSTEEFQSQLQTRLNAAISPATVAVSAMQGRSVLTVTRTDGSADTHLLSALSFASDYATTMVVVPKQELPARSIRFAPQFDGPPCLCIHSNVAELFHINHFISPYEQHGSSVLDRVQQSAGAGEILFYVNRNPLQCRTMRDHRLTRVTCWVTFAADRVPLDFQGYVWCVKLRIVAKVLDESATPTAAQLDNAAGRAPRRG